MGGSDTADVLGSGRFPIDLVYLVMFMDANLNQSFDNADITPDRSIIPKLGKGGYSFPQAIAELVDNSIDAMKPKTILHISIALSDQEIIVDDNAKGMSKSDLIKAMTLAYRPPSKKKGLGEFGIGMKAACMALGSYFEIVTTPKDGNSSYKIVFNEEDWVTKGDWQRFPILELQRIKQDSGTTITIRSVRLKRIRSRAKELREEFGMRYLPLLRDKLIILAINDYPCQYYEWTIINNEKHIFNIDLKNEEIINGWWGLLETGSPIGLYGFNLYHKGRLIQKNQKIGFTAHPGVSHLIGEINMDCIPVSYNKREFIETAPEYEEFIKKFKLEINEALRIARLYRSDQPMELPASFINQIQNYFENLTELVTDDNLEKEFRIIKITSIDNKGYEMEIQKKERNIHAKISFVEGQISDPQILSLDLNDENRININLNSSHPMFLLTKNRAIVVSNSILEAILLTNQKKLSIEVIQEFLKHRDHMISIILSKKEKND